MSASLGLGAVFGVLALSLWTPRFFVYDEREEILRTSLWVSANANPISIGLGSASLAIILCTLRYFGKKMNPTSR